MDQEDKILSAIGLVNDKIGTGRKDKRYIIDRVEDLEDRLLQLEKAHSVLLLEHSDLSNDVDELNTLADYMPDQNLRMSHHLCDYNPEIGTDEYYRELSAAAAESEGHIILTEQVKEQVIAKYLNELDVPGAIKLLQGRMLRLLPGVKKLEVSV